MSKKEDILTHDLVRSIFDYKDGKLFWRKNTYRNVHKAGDFVGCYTKDGYYVITFNKIRFLGHRIIFLWHHGWLPEEIDHEDNNPSNCKIENLRSATQSQNKRNRSKSKNKSSKYLGVSYWHNSKKWHSQIRAFKGENNKNIGSFDTEKEAALAYNRAAVRYHKEFANLNILQLE